MPRLLSLKVTIHLLHLIRGGKSVAGIRAGVGVHMNLLEPPDAVRARENLSAAAS